MVESGIKYDLKSLLEQYRVVIPLIQRDYAQGRKDIRTTEVRKQLLKDINFSLLNFDEPPLDLNFIYGKSLNDAFIPLDGQQRLTTLFLVYIFAFRDSENSDFLKNFSYETRDSSKQFFISLYNNRKEIFSNSNKPSEIIKDSAWFADTWVYDPTISGALVTLDSIPEYFDFHFDYSVVLLNNRRIEFNFLDIKNLGSEDELYIKLNSRGRPLTDFENFKARFISRINDLDVDLSSEISHKIDTSWTDVIWKLDESNFDTNFLNVFEIALINNLDSLDYSQRNGWTSRIIFEDIKLEHVKLIEKVLDFLSKNEHAKVSKILKRLIQNKSLKDRVYFHIISKYLLINGSDLDVEFKNWYRIFRNLISNSDIDSQERYERAINGVNEQLDHTLDLLEFIARDNKITGFNIEQMTEEIEKARLILDNRSLANIIYRAEKHPYFGGQIRGSFYFERNDSSIEKLTTISKYWEKIERIFESEHVKEGILLRTALLSLGDYTLKVDSYKTLCQDDPNEGSSTPSLKRLFSSQNKYVKILLDELDETQSLQDEYNRIIDKNIIRLDVSDWRYAFIKYYNKMFGRMNHTQYRLKSPEWAGRPNEMLLIPNKNSRARNFDIHLLALLEKLKEYKLYAEYYSEPGLSTVDRYLILDDYQIRFYSDKFVFKKEGDPNWSSLVENSASFESIAEYLQEKIKKC
ncbi:TPA: DUF262 domain-containing protein [Streptococcus suis]